MELETKKNLLSLVGNTGVCYLGCYRDVIPYSLLAPFCCWVAVKEVTVIKHIMRMS